MVLSLPGSSPWPDRRSGAVALLLAALLAWLTPSSASQETSAPTTPDVLPGDYVFFSNATSPRLDGPVIHVGAGQEFADLEAALPAARPGTLVVLHSGTHVLPDHRSGWRDVAIVGEDPDTTVLSGEFIKAERLRIERVRIDCRNDEVLDLRGGTAQLRDCHLFQYNSGAGGSNAIFGQDAVVLLERCTFEGRSGRGTQDGNALDLRGRSFLFARRCQFVNNSEIVRAEGHCVFDRCKAQNDDEDRIGILAMEHGVLLLRENDTPVRDVQHAKFLTAVSDDLRVVRTLAGDAVPAEDRRVAEPFLTLERSVPYWIGLLRHHDADVRSRARRRLAKLVDVDMPRKQWRDAAAADPFLVLQELEASWLGRWYETGQR